MVWDIESAPLERQLGVEILLGYDIENLSGWVICALTNRFIQVQFHLVSEFQTGIRLSDDSIGVVVD